MSSWPLRNLHCDVDIYSFRRSRSLGNSNKFGQMQELTNDNFSDIKLFIPLLNIRLLDLLLIKKSQQLHA